jgi:hypothetical protein
MESNPRFCRNRANHRKQAQKRAILSATGYRGMTLYDHRPTRFFSATKEFHGDSKAVLSASNGIPEQAVGRLFSA